YQQALRMRVAQAGLYRKHSLDAPLLIGFKQYLTKDLGVANYSQEVENVSRFLFFMDQTAPSLNFVKDIRKTRDFFNQMKTVGLSHQTIANYIKNINRFLRYILNATNVRVMDPTLANFIINFQSILKDVQRKNSKDVTQEITRKRYRQLQKPEPNTTECWKVLRVAKKDVLHVLGKTYNSEEITGTEQLLVMYYLQAVLQLKHLQRPGVVKNMTSVVSPSGQKMVIIGVKEHKTASQQLASFALNEEEEHMFHVYFTQLRSNAKDSSCGQEEEKFFISSAGDPIYNPSNDLRRLHQKYCLPFITSQVARRAFETAAINVTDAQKSIVADYLAHSNSTAEKHYRMLTHANICSAIEVIEGFAEGSQSRSRSTMAAAGFTSTKLDDSTAFQQLIQVFPVTLDGQLPKKKKRVSLTGSHDRHCYDRWRTEQRKMRQQNITDHYARHLPTERQVTCYIQKMGWSANTSTASDVLEKWKPNLELPPNDNEIKKLVKRQSWKGLHIVVDPVKGKKVVTSRRFQKGEVVCDFHGEVITKTAAEALMEQMPEGGMRYLFFFDGPVQKMCIDARGEHCTCHPDKETIGRQIHFSKKKDNIRPVLETFIINEQPILTILFLAKRDIAEREELLFDFSVSRKSFQGEEQPLEWLDH
ncbi:KMT5A methyltransferase, partial [Atractosteus spatula]|nr:KMT5A methyltransferase [Atractosteus spatula]